MIGSGENALVVHVPQRRRGHRPERPLATGNKRDARVQAVAGEARSMHLEIHLVNADLLRQGRSARLRSMASCAIGSPARRAFMNIQCRARELSPRLRLPPPTSEWTPVNHSSTRDFAGVPCLSQSRVSGKNARLSCMAIACRQVSTLSGNVSRCPALTLGPGSPNWPTTSNNPRNRTFCCGISSAISLTNDSASAAPRLKPTTSTIASPWRRLRLSRAIACSTRRCPPRPNASATPIPSSVCARRPMPLT